MKRLLGIALAVAFSATVASATDLSITLESGGTSDLQNVTPGSTVDYEVYGLLSDASNQGLALWACDIEFSGGDLSQGAAGAGMDQFVRFDEFGSLTNDGITNPAGYGGTTTVPGRVGDLVQAGGGMNTIKNVAGNAAFPVGTVTEFIAQGTRQLLMTGSLTAPLTGGPYVLSATNCFGNVITQGETGVPFWATESLGGVNVTNLDITLETCAQAASLNFATLNLTQYPCEATLPRIGGNLLRFEFSQTVAAPAPGDIEINVITGPGTYGPDISLQFGITVEGGNVLTITETGNVFANNTWYAIRNIGGWCEAGDFEVNYGVAYGDVDGFGGTGFNDLQAVFNIIPPIPPPSNSLPDSARGDVDTLGGIGFNDLQAVFNNIPGPGDPVLGPNPNASGCSP